jgi:branched-chain amino acid transport system permease protein
MAVLDAIIAGLLVGLAFAVLAVGFTLTWGTVEVINIAHAAFGVLGAYLGYYANTRFGVDPLLSLLVVIPLFFAFGFAFYEVLIRRLIARTQDVAFASLVLTLGLMFALENSMVSLFSADPRLVKTSYTAVTIRIAEVPVPGGRLVGGGVAVVTLAAIYLFLTRTYVGRAVRAVSENPEGAMLCGIDRHRVSAITFGLGLSTAGIGGVALSLFYSFDPATQLSWLVNVFLVTVFGGIGSIVGAGAAGGFTGLVTEFSALVVPFAIVDLVLFGILFVILLVRPEGLIQ